MDKNEALLNFLLASINDIQGTIRAIDAKVFAFLVILVIPLTELSKIFSITTNICFDGFLYISLFYFITYIFVASWFISFITSFYAIIGIENPKKNILLGEQKILDLFYASDIFRVPFLKSYFQRTIKSSLTLNEYISKFKVDQETLINELIYEQVKLCFIRTLKFKRQKIVFISGMIWIISGGIIWLINLFQNL